MRNTEKDAAEMSAKRDLMLKTGFRIFSKQVIEAVSMQDVAKECNLGIATLYRYFATKLEFVIAIGSQKWQEYYLEVEELYKKLDGKNMNAAQEFEFYLDSYIRLYREHKDILRFNKNFDSYIRHESATPEQMQPYNDAINVFTKKFHTIFIKAEKDGTLRIDIPEEKLFLSLTYIMFPVISKCAEGFVYLGENITDMTDDLIALKNMILNQYLTVKGKNFCHEIC